METMCHLKNVLESVNNLWEGVEESFQFKWLRKFLSVSELKLKLKAWISLFYGYVYVLLNFSILIFASTKFCDFSKIAKITKFNSREINW